jgi:hypothetical protein
VKSSADAPAALAALPPAEGAHTPPVAASPVRPEPPRTAASPPLEPPPAEVAARAPLRTETPPRTAADAPADVSSRPDPPSPRRPSEDARVSRRRGASGRADGPRGTSADVRRWLQRWAAAWNTHDVDALRRMGQMATARDAEAVRRYLAQVSDLEVSVNLVELREEGERVIVRFIRRDRFRDPAGRLVEHESPPIEKVLLRTGDGFRVVHGRG